MWFNLFDFSRGLETLPNVILVMFFFFFSFMECCIYSHITAVLSHDSVQRHSGTGIEINHQELFPEMFIINLASNDLLGMWTKFAQYFPLSSTGDKNASQAFKFGGFMRHSYFFFPVY